MRRFLIVVMAVASLSACYHTESNTESEVLEDNQAPFIISDTVLDTSGSQNLNSQGRDHVSMVVPFAPVNDVKKQIEARTAISLKDRGEAHVTVITPPELSVLKHHLSGAEILDSLGNDNLQGETFETVCVGSGSKSAGSTTLRTFFVVVKSAGLVARRRALEDKFIENGGEPGAFSAQKFYPHITIGFTKRDLHEQDGVIKNEGSCIAPLAVQ